MKHFNNALEIFKLLNASNCRECGMQTCLAFAGAVYTGKKKLRECPHIPPEILEQYAETPAGKNPSSENTEKALQQLKQQVADTDLSELAEGLGGVYANGRLTIKVLGKNFSVTDSGDIVTDIHVNPWVVLPVYTYIIRGCDKDLSGRWVPLRELPSGQDWFRLFGQRCEKPLKKIADAYPDLFEDMVRMFDAKHVARQYEADVSVVLYPLPKVPMLICYWHPENELDSDLNLFFDETAEDFVDLNSLNSLGSGFVTMLEKFILQHAGGK